MQELITKVEGYFGGPMEIGYVQESSGLWIPQFTVPRNLILYRGADILARLLGGDTKYIVNTMYFEYTNGVVPSITPLPGEGQSYYSGLTGSQDFIRSPVDLTPLWSSSDVAKYTGNIVRFFSATAGTAGYHSVAFSQGAGSKVYGGALVATPTDAFSGDIVFARFYFPSALTKLDGMQIGIKWGVQFS